MSNDKQNASETESAQTLEEATEADASPAPAAETDPSLASAADTDTAAEETSVPPADTQAVAEATPEAPTPTESSPASPPVQAASTAPRQIRASQLNLPRLAMMGGAAVAIIAVVFYLFSGGSGDAGKLVKKMPASAGAIGAMDLTSITEDPHFKKLTGLGLKTLGGDAKELLAAMPINSFKTAACATDETMKNFACVIKGEFDADKGAPIIAKLNRLTENIEVEGKKGWSKKGDYAQEVTKLEEKSKTAEAYQKKSIKAELTAEESKDKAETLVINDESSIILGHRKMVGELVKSLSGEGKTAEENKSLVTALNNVDSDAMLVIAAADLNMFADLNKITGAVSVSMGSSLEVKVFLKTDDERTQEKINEVQMGFEMARSMLPMAIDEAIKKTPSYLESLATPWAEFAKEFVENIEISEADGGLIVESSASLPEGGIMKAAAQAVSLSFDIPASGLGLDVL